ncbi:aldo/keto reductase [Nocardioides daeguensis]|uniref:Aldo/keto reductase n=1 Tax=Nocardioides daeguensis TaxID=908359 RepID=A0ABP6V2X1_9ACTN|nr:aldo/keto reductase [Nocardioides daeguensis]MBV6729684.1 aldo/keto reductase [Nocardioides daeguensis]MCR1774711.1 aldo/keto reductase [Nocardioides daeguensis]
MITRTLNNGVDLPALGLGVFQTPPDETRAAVETALSLGYRHVDTAAVYGNERQVGEAIRASGLPREEVFVETKIWISDFGYEQALRAYAKSARKLDLGHVDLLLLHWPLPSAFDRTREAYRALEKLLADGEVRAIGVSNFQVQHLRDLLAGAEVVPAVNQLELHPYHQQREVQALDAELGILDQAWSPLGGATFYRDSGHANLLEDPVVSGIAHDLGRTPAQVLLRWGLQHGRSVIPKSVRPERIAENLDVLGFELEDDQAAALDALDTGRAAGPTPEQVTLEDFHRDIPDA